MKYIPYHELGDLPNIIVDGAPNESTKLTLSHWPHSGTPRELKDDLSAQIVFRYLDRPDLHVPVEAVSNNHFDEDGLISLFAFLNPEATKSRRDLLVDIAAAGDFGTFRFREAARIAFILAAFYDPDRSPLSTGIFQLPHLDATAILYQETLNRFPEILSHPERFRELWDAEEQELLHSEKEIQSGRIRIQETPALDLAVVTVPENEDCHTMALHNATRCFRVLQMTGRKYAVKFRYETWVQYISAPVQPRVDLTPLAQQLSGQDTGRWEFPGVDTIIPCLRRVDGNESNIPPEVFRNQVETFLATAPAAWNPFDPL